jgi:predicted esterase
MSLALVLALALQDPPQTGLFPVKLKDPASEYWMWVPKDYVATRSWPLVVLLHGAGDEAKNFIQFWEGTIARYNYVAVAVKSAGNAWEDSDSTRILKTMEDVKKNHRIDPERVFLLGYSSGGFMACRFGVKNHALFRAMAALSGAQEAGGKEFKDARAHMSVFILCGDGDPNLGICKRTFEYFKKGAYDTEFKEVKGMGHSPLKQPEATDWVLERFHSRDSDPAGVLARAKKALAAKRGADAIADYKGLLESKAEEKFKKEAQAGLDRLEKEGRKKLDDAGKKTDPKAARKLYEEIARDYAGLECAAAAEEKLKEP